MTGSDSWAARVEAAAHPGGWGAEPGRAAVGFCYAFRREKLWLGLFGAYPSAERWGAAISGILFVAMILISGDRRAWKPWL